jgi:cellulase/cellobiase CelA1
MLRTAWWPWPRPRWWLDSIAAVRGSVTAMGLAAHLDQAVAQAAGHPMVVQLVVYNLPGRNCGRLASNGEFGPNDLPRYKTEFIDPIAEILSRPAYANLRIVTVIEPDSLPNLVVNTGTTRPTATWLCNTMLDNQGYVSGIGYALARLGALPNVANYLDVANHGVIGWEEDLAKTVNLLAQAASTSGSTLANVRGFATNTANYSPLREPFIPMTDRYRTSRWIDFNQFNDELTFAQAMRVRLIEVRTAPARPSPTKPSTACATRTTSDLPQAEVRPPAHSPAPRPKAPGSRPSSGSSCRTRIHPCSSDGHGRPRRVGRGPREPRLAGLPPP